MVRVFVRHPVSDFSAWKRAYDEFDETRQGMGVKGHGVFQAIDDPNDITVWHDFEDERAAQAFMDSSVLRDTMNRAGVSGEPTVWFTKRA